MANGGGRAVGRPGGGKASEGGGAARAAISNKATVSRDTLADGNLKLRGAVGSTGFNTAGLSDGRTGGGVAGMGLHKGRAKKRPSQRSKEVPHTCQARANHGEWSVLNGKRDKMRNGGLKDLAPMRPDTYGRWAYVHLQAIVVYDVPATPSMLLETDSDKREPYLTIAVEKVVRRGMRRVIVADVNEDLRNRRKRGGIWVSTRVLVGARKGSQWKVAYYVRRDPGRRQIGRGAQ